MKLKIKFIFFVLIIHAVQFALAYFLFEVDKIYFLIMEVLIIASLIISFILYREFLRPYRLLGAGIESIKDQDFNMKFKTVGHNELDGLIHVFNKMLDQLRIERIKLSEKNFFLDKLVENSPSGIIILSLEGEIAQINEMASRQLGLSKETLMGQSLVDVEGHLFNEMNALKVDESTIIQMDGIKKLRCRKSSFVEKGFRREFFILEELTHELLRSERSSYEKIIRVMSHEVNNTIGAVNSIIKSSLRFKSQWESFDNDALTPALEVAVERNDHLNLFMKNFADVVKLPKPLKELCDVNELFKKLALLFSDQLKAANITWEKEVDEQPVELMVDTVQIELVLINIIKNAIEAIESYGWIRVTTRPTYLTIENNGESISIDTQKKIFEPFFSSKPNGQGIGLTLSREILLNHEFDFSLSTDNEDVTCFRIGYENL